MTLPDLLELLNRCPLIASVQASEGSPLDDPAILIASARASETQGVSVLRLEGVNSIRRVREASEAATIGLMKRRYAGSEVYISPTAAEVSALVETGCDVVALDATPRERPNAESLHELVSLIHGSGRLALGDCDSLDAARFAIDAGVDLVATTLAGYTSARPTTGGPDWELLRQLVVTSSVPVLAEGRFTQPWQVSAALRIGAVGVVVGGALNDPVKQTRAFVRPAQRVSGKVGAVDIGGTWLRFATFSNDWALQAERRIPLPLVHAERMAWITSQIEEFGVQFVGVSSGGTVDPRTGIVSEAKAIIPDLIGRSLIDLPVPAIALNDGLASAWGHACHPAFAARRVGTLALGTGVGCGFVADHRLVVGPEGQYARLNDLPGPDGVSYEELLGGAALSPNPTDDQKRMALQAAKTAIQTLTGLYMPDAVVLCGGVGLSAWLDPDGLCPPDTAAFKRAEVVRTPFGHNAGLYGAAALALFPPDFA